MTRPGSQVLTYKRKTRRSEKRQRALACYWGERKKLVMQCAFYEWHERSGNVQQDPRKPKKMDLQANAMEASQLEGSDQCWTWRTDSAFMEISRERSCCLLMEKHAKVSEGYSREKVQGTNRSQFRTSSDGDFQFQRRVAFKMLLWCYKPKKTIRYYIITQGKGLPRRRYFHMMLTNTMYWKKNLYSS